MEFEIEQKLLNVPGLLLPTDADRWASGHVSATVATRGSTVADRRPVADGGADLGHGRMAERFHWTCMGMLRKMVVSPPRNGHRRNSGEPSRGGANRPIC
jgi:hypothetical protein